MTPFEMPYVVYLQNVLRVGEPQPLFFFEHPNKGEAMSCAGRPSGGQPRAERVRSGFVRGGRSRKVTC